MAFGMTKQCKRGPPQGTASMAYAYLQNSRDEPVPEQLVGVAKRTVIREPLLLTKTGNFGEIQEANTLRTANRMLLRTDKCTSIVILLPFN